MTTTAPSNWTTNMVAATEDATECDNDCGTMVLKQASWRALSATEHQTLIEAGFNGHGARGMCAPCYMRDYVRAYDPNDEMVVAARTIAAEYNVFPPADVDFTPTRTREAEEWTADAACNYTDPEAFFPKNRSEVAVVKRVCGGCPVRVECLLSAIAHREEHGIWGGLTEHELDRLYSDLDAARPDDVEAVVRTGRGLLPGDDGFVEPELASLVSEFDEQDATLDELADTHFGGDDA